MSWHKGVEAFSGSGWYSSCMTTDPQNQARLLLTELANQARQYARLMRFDKPIGIWLLLWPTLWGLWIAGKGHPEPRIFLVFVIGVIVMRSAGCVINDFADRNLDGKVLRTQDRPLATGAVSPAEALVLFCALGLIAIALVLTLDPLTQSLAVIGAILTISYPFMKRLIAAPQLVLGAAFGWSIPMAFAAQTGEIPRLAWLIWLAVIVWAVIYDTIYAMVDREDDLKLGIKSTAILFGGTDVFIITLLQIILMFAFWLIGAAAHLGAWYFSATLFTGLFFIYQFLLIRHRQPDACFRAFLNNNYVGAAIFIGILLDYTFSAAV
ncbi:MAG: 4-hydroxybenzoate octaprenyltransferase [Gammaproteobacteria bacterium]|nr:4-hydroxybenzoate octaprenyltransferase [Gammaproteobacteria bacterium]